MYIQEGQAFWSHDYSNHFPKDANNRMDAWQNTGPFANGAELYSVEELNTGPGPSFGPGNEPYYRMGFVDAAFTDPTLSIGFTTWYVSFIKDYNWVWKGDYMPSVYMLSNGDYIEPYTYPYSHQLFINNKLWAVVFDTEDGVRQQCSIMPTVTAAFPYIIPVGHTTIADSICTPSIHNYTPSVERFIFSNDKTLSTHHRGYKTLSWSDGGTWCNLNNSGNMSYPPLYTAATQGPCETVEVNFFTMPLVQREQQHWKSNTQTLQQGFFALNQPYGCNGIVNFVTDNQSYFATGTKILSVFEWTHSSTIIDPSYINLRDSAIAYLTCTKIGKVVNSYVLGSPVETFEIDFDTCELEDSVLAGAGNFKLSKASPTSFIILKTSCCYLDMASIAPESIEASNSAIHFGTLTSNKYNFSSSETTLNAANVDLTLVNYMATNLTVAATTSMSLYIGTSLTFDACDLNILVQNTVACTINMVDCEFLDIPTQIKLVATEAGPYSLQHVYFDKNTSDPLQTWVGDVVTYQVAPGKLTEVNLTQYGIPTNKLPTTPASSTGTTKLSDRIVGSYDYSNLFGGPMASTPTENKAINLKYDVEDVSGLDLPPCKR